MRLGIRKDHRGLTHQRTHAAAEQRAQCTKQDRAIAALAAILACACQHGPEASPRDAVHVVPAGEKVRPEYTIPAPDVTESEATGEFQLLNLPALVRMKLVSFRDKDRTHLRDLIELGLLDASWLPGLPPDLRDRLQTLLNDPEG